MSESEFEVQDLWIERTADRLGFDSVARTLFQREELSPYLFVVTAVAFHLPLLSVVGWLQTGVLSIVVNPGEVFQLVAWPAVIWVLLRTKSKYAAVVADLPDAIDDDVQAVEIGGGLAGRMLTVIGVPASPTGKTDADLEQFAPRRVFGAILLAGLAAYAAQLLANPDSLVGPVAELTGPVVAGIRFYLVIPFVLYPIGAEFLTVVVGVLVLLPFKIRRARLVDFSDPHGFAGLSPAGDLFKSVAVSYFVLLTLFTTFQTVGVGASPTSMFSSALLLSGLAVGLIFFFAPMFWVKSFVGDAKEAKIDALAQRSRQVGDTDDRLPYAEPNSPESVDQYTYDYLRIQQVDSTSEFPLDVAMLQEVLFALVLPYVTSLAFDFVVNSAA
ncbi:MULTISPECIES: hypothetical protein [Halobacterium]|uniref:hypothetical protein n=1 Tax=Halobacterium TaxID=2239 RepID=UPI00073F299E|nr:MULTISPECIES: hypothetical protein [Halobacterium]MCG1003436.1 hypothetical protein [Halobacterium noricense]